jgi:hypothetical protein
MKTVRFFFVLVAAALLPGTSLAQQADRASQQSSSQRGERSGDRQKDEIHNDKDKARPNPADEAQAQLAGVTRSTTKRRLSAGHSKPVPTYRVRPVRKPTANSPQVHEPGSVVPLEPTGSKTDTKTSNNVASRRSPSVPSSAVSVNGQQFKNSRDPGARLAASGGPATIARGTAAINGTGMKRKP